MLRVTMQDVADLSGVAIATVSLYFRKPHLVRAKTQAKIAAAAAQLSYVPNVLAGGLAAAGSRVVSLIVPTFRHGFFAETTDAMQAGLAASGVQLLVGHTEYDKGREEALVRAALGWAPAAIVLTGMDHSAETRNMLVSHGTSVIEIWEIGDNAIDMLVGTRPSSRRNRNLQTSP